MSGEQSKMHLNERTECIMYLYYYCTTVVRDIIVHDVNYIDYTVPNIRMLTCLQVEHYNCCCHCQTLLVTVVKRALCELKCLQIVSSVARIQIMPTDCEYMHGDPT